jgi:hypothetical protein
VDIKSNYLVNCCSQLIHLLAKYKILGNDEKEAAMLLRNINEDPEVYGIAMALEPYIDFEMARNWADKCFGNSMIYYLMVYNLFPILWFIRK